jgi:hypothetical protein
MKYCEIIADNLKKVGWSRVCVSALDSSGRTIFVADAHRGDGRRFVVRADELVGLYCGIPRRINVLIRRRVPGSQGSRVASTSENNY